LSSGYSYERENDINIIFINTNLTIVDQKLINVYLIFKIATANFC